MDKIFFNGNIYTMNPDMPWATAVGIRNNKIAVVGSDMPVKACVKKDTIMIDVKGKTIVPGLNDSHMHVIDFGQTLSTINLKTYNSIDEIIINCRKYIKDKSPNNMWVVGRGWDNNCLSDKRMPNRYDLDKISEDIPIILIRTCGHIACINSKALRIAGISRHTKLIEGGYIVLDNKGIPNGILYENAISFVKNNIPIINNTEIKELIKKSLNKLKSKGITSVHSDDFKSFPNIHFTQIIKAYLDLKKSGDLNIRIYQQCNFSKIEELTDFIKRSMVTGKGDNIYRIGPLKLILDGSLGGGTAFMREAYKNDPNNNGLKVYNKDELTRIMVLAHEVGMQIAVHCIGDAAIDMAMDIFEYIRIKIPKINIRHGIVYCQITDRKLLHRLSQMNIIAYIQPILINNDMHILPNIIEKKRINDTYNWGTMMRTGVKVAGGSGYPIGDIDVLKNIYSAVTRKDLNGFPEGGWIPEQKLTLEQALKIFTIGGAYASFEEHKKGMIKSGMLADMTVLSDDLFNIKEDDIKDIQVEMTIFNGEIVYDKS